MNSIEHRLTTQLAALSAQGNRRELPTERAGIDFWSNDYLGIARDFPVVNAPAGGSTGSRLISGNRNKFMEIEAMIAHYHGTEAALVFSTGYSANLGLLSAIPQRGDTILYDQLIHASLRDGIRLGIAAAYSFNHNDLQQLADKLARAKGQCFVVTESIFSMDGDAAPLLELVELCEQFGAALIVDEAHAIGLYGPQGSGLVNAYGLEHRVFARVVAYGKAMGCHGAAVLGSRVLIDYLVNKARPFIFSTGMSAHGWNFIEASYLKLSKDYRTRAGELAKRVLEFREKMVPQISNSLLILPGNEAISDSKATVVGPIQLVLRPGNEEVLALEKDLASNGLLVKAIRHPTVAKGAERIRICLHAFNTSAEIERLTKSLSHAH